jgi:hypothetical protein
LWSRFIFFCRSAAMNTDVERRNSLRTRSLNDRR